MALVDRGGHFGTRRILHREEAEERQILLDPLHGVAVRTLGQRPPGDGEDAERVPRVRVVRAQDLVRATRRSSEPPRRSRGSTCRATSTSFGAPLTKAISADSRGWIVLMRLRAESKGSSRTRGYSLAASEWARPPFAAATSSAASVGSPRIVHPFSPCGGTSFALLHKRSPEHELAQIRGGRRSAGRRRLELARRLVADAGDASAAGRRSTPRARSSRSASASPSCRCRSPCRIRASPPTRAS